MRRVRTKRPTPRTPTPPRSYETGYFKYLIMLDTEITKNFRASGIRTRPVQGNGLWCCLLIPGVLISYTCTHKVTPVYRLITYLAFSQFCYSILLMLFLFMSTLILQEKLSAGCVMSTLVSAILIYCHTESSLIFVLFFSGTSVYLYSFIVKHVLHHCPKTFTVGEAMVVCQAAVLFLNMELGHIYYSKYKPELMETDYEMRFIKTVVFTVLSTVGLIVTALYCLKTKRTLENLGIIVASGAVIAILVIIGTLGLSSITYSLYFITSTYTRRCLVMFWLILVAVTIIATIVYTKLGLKATTATRKGFHISASMVFLSGILYDVRFLTLAAGVVFSVIIFLEALRLSKIKPLASKLQAAFDAYSDEKDCGVFATTPIYLFCGLACPLLLVPWCSGNELELMSGVLSIGVGDTAASWFGHQYGKNKWPGSNKTMEGTSCNIGTQIFFIYVLNMFGILDTPYCLIRGAIAATISGLAEAHINQVDNLVLPLITLLAFEITFFLGNTKYYF